MTKNNRDEQIKNCPFCGSKGRWVEDDDYFVDYIECSNCSLVAADLITWNSQENEWIPLESIDDELIFPNINSKC